MKATIVLAIIALSFCVKIKEQKNSATVHIAECMPQMWFTYRQISAIPSSVVPGDSLTISAQAIAKSQRLVDWMKIKITHNGADYATDEVRISEFVDVGMDIDFEYTFEIPTSEGLGRWELVMDVQDDRYIDLACIGAGWNFEE